MSCGVGCRCSFCPALLWLWYRPAAVALIPFLAWAPLYAAAMVLKSEKKKRDFPMPGCTPALLRNLGLGAGCGVFRTPRRLHCVAELRPTAPVGNVAPTAEKSGLSSLVVSALGQPARPRHCLGTASWHGLTAPPNGRWVGPTPGPPPASLLAPQEEDVFVRCVSVLGNLADQLYYPCEHVAWAADAKILHVDSARWWTLSTTFWGLSLLLGIAR